MSTVLLERREEGKNSESIEIEFIDTQDKIEEGTIELTLEATDSSFWGQTRRVSFQLEVDFSRPSLTILNRIHEIQYGSTKLLFLQADDDGPTVTGVSVEGHIFPGYSAHHFDEDLRAQNLYVVPFTIPLDTAPRIPEVLVFAEDTVGNSSSESVSLNVLPRPTTELIQDISESSLKLYQQMIEKNHQELLQYPDRWIEEVLLSHEHHNPLVQAKIIHEPLQELTEIRLRKQMESSQLTRTWLNPLVRQAGTLTNTFGATVLYQIQGQNAAKRVQRGYDIAVAKENSQIIAAASGTVLYAGLLGSLHHCVIVDHGLGLYSLYGGLQSITARPGQKIDMGDTMGIALSSGDKAHYYFEVRLSGEPVDPSEWWTKRWFSENIILPTNDLKKKLHIPLRLS
jgi:Peptidase family M23